MVTGQLVERDRLSRDDFGLLEELYPELKKAKVLQDDGTFVSKRASLLLAGPVRIGVWSGHDITSFTLFDTHVNIDWAGVMVERATNRKSCGIAERRHFANDKILKPMFQNHVPEMPDFAQHAFPHPARPRQRASEGRGLLAVTSTFWAGIANCFWWCKP
ncbi:hypothetical protein H112_08158 [Trichophyton rubrum D6]|uniref:Uncharacterized protein n=2 Tax=Trichophyton TaxID=5550 RepID=A0A022VPR9_TRIRU|nr:hypothetical protein H100_08185 [Trichophyton rubrum MR850]EZF37438.1 hypothetical protein H102_08142 [Trichophyton rubrum CBS 100081]EZF48065.1 hypothetical protein H103_08168 [Trichophyton rubrum CBS 288.86]EZF69323.1 hypothetical protein H105_08169 [Trichophyton soudanense CBS 452.61]EZF80045.1 hypothetical protein H110_08171 [Trichophyton rubrum MR1448]EZF90659.1 hypothetical protein H113_08233 [Trichophyton rubrum MR1459]EZG01629.1 hypothetical protein H106_08040 [Trichophyton rubrum 